MIEVLCAAICVGLGAAYLTELLRTLGFLRRWRDRKPLGCDICMSFWAALALSPCATARLPPELGLALLVIFGGAGVSRLALELRSSALPPPLE